MSIQDANGPIKGCSPIGTMPMRGLRISAQPIASSSGGVTIGIRMAPRNRFRPGRSVRSSSQLKPIATTIAKIVLPAAKISVFSTNPYVYGEYQTAR